MLKEVFIIEYTINQLAQLAGVTTRTLRYYDQINLLTPSYLTEAGYRIYAQKEIDKLQQILFFRELEIKLEDIRTILIDPEVDYLQLLSQHRQALLVKQDRLKALINTIDQTIESKRGEITMKNEEKFEGFKQALVDQNEAHYGTEIREKYGDQSVAEAKAKMLNMSETVFMEWQKTEQELLRLLAAHQQIALPSAQGKRVFDLHKKWLSSNLKQYDKTIHQGIASMYVTDPRFTAYYDQKAGSGAAIFLNKVVQLYA